MRKATLVAIVVAALACSQTDDVADSGAGGIGGQVGGRAGAGGRGPRDGGAPACIPASPEQTCDPACPAGQHCWDFKDHDPYCGGKACTAACCTDADCVAFYANHPNAANARCGADHLCDPIGFGGSFFCAAR